MKLAAVVDCIAVAAAANAGDSAAASTIVDALDTDDVVDCLAVAASVNPNRNPCGCRSYLDRRRVHVEIRLCSIRQCLMNSFHRQ